MTSRKRLQYTTFDVFTQTPFKGNPLAIVKVPKGFELSKNDKQTIAREFNYSETVFFHASEHGPSPIGGIDIFTTTEELPFAGHPVIGTICSIAPDASPEWRDDLILSTKAGVIRAAYDDKSSSAIARVPHDVHIHQDCLQHSRVRGLQPNIEDDDLLDMWPSGSDGYSTFPVVSVVKGMTFILIGFPTNSGALQKLQTGRQLTYAKALSLDEEWLPSFVAPYYYEVLSEDSDHSLNIRARMIGKHITWALDFMSVGAFSPRRRSFEDGKKLTGLF